MTQNYARLVQTSVTNFLHCDGRYLFVKRSGDKSVDAGKINGIGGKLEPGENYLDCAIRETKEETGYEVADADCRLAAIVNIEGGYDEDWVVCFFVVEVPTQEVPAGLHTSEGEFLWLTPEELFEQENELVDDLNYVFKDVARGKELVFFNAQVSKQEKITEYSLKSLKI